MARVKKFIGNVKGPEGPQGPKGEQGPQGEQGPKGPKGADATINGVNALTLAAGDNIALSQSGGTLTISANVPTKVSELENNSGFLTDHQDISGKLDASRVGAANGVAELDENGKVPSAQLPSYVDDVLERASVSAFPATGESGKIYVAIDTNVTYRWSGSAYVEISPSLALGETSATAYRGDRGKIAYAHSQTQSGNPHKVSKSDIGLGAVDNTSDADKPISDAAQAELDKKQDKETQSEIDAAQNSRIADLESENAAQNQDIADLQSENALMRELLKGVDAPVYRTASGNPAMFADGYDNATIKSCVVAITPTQSGSGDPYPPGGGKNILPPKTNVTSGTLSGVSYVVNADGSITLNGTSTATANLWFYSVASETTAHLTAGEYVISCAGITNASNMWLHIRTVPADDSNESSIPYSDCNTNQNGGRFTVSEITAETYPKIRVGFYFKSGVVFDNATIYPMLRRASETDPSWAPYANIRPISGVSSVTVTRTDEYGAESADAQTVTVQLTDGTDPLTVYGGSLDVISGTLAVTHGQIASYNGETVPDSWISDRDVYAAGTVPTTGAQVVYPLAAPLSYNLTPISLTSLHGYNCVSSADAGTLSVTYRADTQITLGG